VLDLIVSTMDQSLLLLPPQYQPQALLGLPDPGAGRAAHGGRGVRHRRARVEHPRQRLVLFWEKVLGRIRW